MPSITFIREVGPFRWAFRTAIRQFYKRIVRRSHKMRLPTGEWLKLPLTNHFGSEAFVTGANVDWGSERLFVSLLRRTGAFLDVGAHIGYYSLYVLPRVSHVYSFEPDPRTRILLANNVGGRPNIEIVPCAAGDTPGKASFTQERDAEVSHLSNANESSANRIEVDVVTLDAFAASRNLTVEAIKIDAEGHDSAIVAGALGLLIEQQPLVLTEASPDAKLFNLTQKAGYRVFAYVRNPRTRRANFTELFPNHPKPGSTKMIFLVPERLVEEIVRNADELSATPIGVSIRNIPELIRGAVRKIAAAE